MWKVCSYPFRINSTITYSTLYSHNKMIHCFLGMDQVISKEFDGSATITLNMFSVTISQGFNINKSKRLSHLQTVDKDACTVNHWQLVQ